MLPACNAYISLLHGGHRGHLVFCHHLYWLEAQGNLRRPNSHRIHAAMTLGLLLTSTNYNGLPTETGSRLIKQHLAANAVVMRCEQASSAQSSHSSLRPPRPLDATLLMTLKTRDRAIMAMMTLKKPARDG